MIGFTNISGDDWLEDEGISFTYWDVIEPHGEVFIDFYPVIGNPNQHIVNVDYGSQNVGYKSYQEAWNHIKTLLPTGE